jgi:hypothetical protein
VNLNQNVYFMSLVGGIAGLLCWGLTATISEIPAATLSGWVVLTVETTVMGALIGGMTVGFADKWGGDRLLFRWVAIGVLLGAAAGAASGLINAPLQAGIQAGAGAARDVAASVALWLITGALIGLVTGLRWAGVNPFRAVHAMVGGMIGGTVGGLVFYFLGEQGEVFVALAYVLTGMGISLGVTLAPVLLRDGILQFISSGDPRAQNKYGSPRQEWLIQSGDRLIIGSQSADQSQARFSRDVQIYIPDALSAKRHAILYERKKQFFLQQHPENVGQRGQPLYALQVDRANVVGTVELRDGDDVLIGQTLLRFYTTRKRAQAEPDSWKGRNR